MYKKRNGIDIDRNTSQRFTDKKAQVTIFIILGILLVLALILIIAFKQEIVTFKPGELVPTSKGKIEQFITACVEQAGNEALEKVGAQGGYITVPLAIVSDS